jgi:hypothetical protein
MQIFGAKSPLALCMHRQRLLRGDSFKMQAYGEGGEGL